MPQSAHSEKQPLACLASGVHLLTLSLVFSQFYFVSVFLLYTLQLQSLLNTNFKIINLTRHGHIDISFPNHQSKLQLDHWLLMDERIRNYFQVQLYLVDTNFSKAEF